MNIGIVGTGMGRTYGLLWGRAGHRVLFGSRYREKAEAAAAACPGSARAGSPDQAALFGEVILYTVRNVLPSKLLHRPESLSGKIVIDCNNSDILGLDVPDPSGRPGDIHFESPVPSLAERLDSDAPGSRVVKAFNTVPAQVVALGREVVHPRGISTFLCSDDEDAKLTVARLAEDLGLVPLDSGGLERARLVESLGDFMRFEILSVHRAPQTTIPADALQAA